MVDHTLFAAAYDRMLAVSEVRGLAERRRRLLAEARGNVLEIGAGTGLNLSHYRSDAVASVVALEPDSAMRRLLLQRVGAGPSGISYQVHEVGIEEAEFAEGSFDTVVATLALCSVADPDGAVRAACRWLAPHGRLLFLEHVRAPGMRGRLQRAVTPLWRRAAAGCRLDRDTLGVLRRAGLVITDCERFAMPAGGVLMSTCVQGVARPRPVVADGAVG